MNNYTILYTTPVDSIPKAFTTVAKDKESAIWAFKLNPVCGGTLTRIWSVVKLPKKPMRLPFNLRVTSF